MKAIVIDKFVESFDEIKISEVPRPEPRDGEVLVKVVAAGVNFVDLLYARGKHQNNRSLVTPPFTLGLEFSGIVISSSPSSSEFPPNTPVFGSHVGTYSEYISVPITSLHKIPKVPGWDFISCAGLAATAPVSYGALLRASLKPNTTILIHASASGLSIPFLQFARSQNCTTICTSSSALKTRISSSFGATHTINYTLNPNWHETALSLTNKRGVDLVFDPVGLVSQSLKCLAPEGKILVVGFAGISDPKKMEKIEMNRVLLRQAQIIGYRHGATQRLLSTHEPEIWLSLNKLIKNGELKPYIFDKKYVGLESVVEAMRDLEERKVWGKGVVRICGEVLEGMGEVEEDNGEREGRGGKGKARL